MRWALTVFPLCFAVSAAQGAETANRYHLPTDFEGAVDQDGARAAVKRGDAAPFLDILRKVRPRIQGEIVGQKLEQHQGVWLYELRIIAPDGHMHYTHFDARTGRPYTVRPLP
jgi:uncharacterized membrane protein YkoI